MSVVYFSPIISPEQVLKLYRLLDMPLPGKVAVNLSAGALETLHSQADAIFRGAITDTLHDAMEPEII